MNEDQNVSITFSKSEAIVLSEFLFRFQNTKKLDVQSDAEVFALLRLGGYLEKSLVELLSPSYQQILEAARKDLETRYGPLIGN